jgi:hypothetical protein
MWVENGRHILPAGRSESYEGGDGFRRNRVHPFAVNGIMIAAVFAGEKPEEESHDDF